MGVAGTRRLRRQDQRRGLLALGPSRAETAFLRELSVELAPLPEDFHPNIGRQDRHHGRGLPNLVAALGLLQRRLPVLLLEDAPPLEQQRQ